MEWLWRADLLRALCGWDSGKSLLKWAFTFKTSVLVCVKCNFSLLYPNTIWKSYNYLLTLLVNYLLSVALIHWRLLVLEILHKTFVSVFSTGWSEISVLSSWCVYFLKKGKRFGSRCWLKYSVVTGYLHAITQKPNHSDSDHSYCF